MRCRWVSGREVCGLGGFVVRILSWFSGIGFGGVGVIVGWGRGRGRGGGFFPGEEGAGGGVAARVLGLFFPTGLEGGEFL